MPRKWGKGDLKAPKAASPPKVPKSGSKAAEETTSPTSSNSKGTSVKAKSGITKDQISAPVMVEKKGEGILPISPTKPDTATLGKDNQKAKLIPETKADTKETKDNPKANSKSETGKTETKPEESANVLGFPKLKKWEPHAETTTKPAKWKPTPKAVAPPMPPDSVSEPQKLENTKSNETPQSNKPSDAPSKTVDPPKSKVPSTLNTAKEKFASMEKVELAKTAKQDLKEPEPKKPNPVPTETQEKPKPLKSSKLGASQEKVEPTTLDKKEAKSQSKDDKDPSATKSNPSVEQPTESINEKPNQPRSEPSRVDMWKDKFEAPKLNNLGRRFSSKEELSKDEPPPKFGIFGRRMSESSKDLRKPSQKEETSKFGIFGRRSTSREKEEIPKFGTFGRRLSSSREELSKPAQKEEPCKFSTFGRRLSSSREELSKPDDLKDKQALQSKTDVIGELPKIEEVQAKLEVATPEPPRKQTAKEIIKPEKVSPADAAKEKPASNTLQPSKLSSAAALEKVSPIEAAKEKLAGNIAPASKLEAVKDKFEAPKVSKFGSRVSQPKDEPPKSTSNVTANGKASIPATVESKVQSDKESVKTKLDSDKNSSKNKLENDKNSIKKADSKVESKKLPLTDLKVIPESPKSCLKKKKVPTATLR